MSWRSETRNTKESYDFHYFDLDCFILLQIQAGGTKISIGLPAERRQLQP